MAAMRGSITMELRWYNSRGYVSTATSQIVIRTVTLHVSFCVPGLCIACPSPTDFDPSPSSGVARI